MSTRLTDNPERLAWQADAETGASPAADALPITPAGEFAGDVDPGAVAAKLTARVSYGATVAELDRAFSIGYFPYLEQQLNPTSMDDSACEARLSPYWTTRATAPRLFAYTTRPAPALIRDQLIEATILRAVYSRRQLFERMVEFWTYHFNIDINNETCIFLKGVDDREVIRPHALGRFVDMLQASARSPAMLFYLDNAFSFAGRPNENYAREVMELHTLGVDAPYTQQDVRELARCFTGWTVHGPEIGGDLAGTFKYDPAKHDTGPKTVLGLQIPARPASQGMQDGIDALNYLASSPFTARNIARKLCRYFLGNAVPASVEQLVADAYLSSNGDIKTMLRVILRPEHVADARRKIKRPYHLCISALRALRVELTGTAWGNSIRTQLSLMGMPPFGWGPPNGYPDDDDYWGTVIYPRWNFTGLLAGNLLSGVPVNSQVVFGGSTEFNAIMFWIAAAAYGYSIPINERNRLQAYLAKNPTSPARQLETLGLAISGPTFQII
jgi:hypothetical protein